MLKKSDMHDYQDRAVTRLFENNESVAIMPMGSGKTIVALTVIEELLSRGEVLRVLVIAPKYVAETVWPIELEKWEHLQNLTVAVACGNAKTRQAALNSNAQIVTTNYENLQSLSALYPPGGFPFDCIIMDELSKFKNPSGKRYAAFQHHLHVATIRIGLTGTPASNHLTSLYNQVKAVDGGKLWGRSWTKWRMAHFYSTDPEQRTWTPWPNTPEKLYKDLSRLAFKISEDELPPVPEPIVLEHYIELPAKARGIYEEAEREFLVTLGARPGADPTEILIANEGAKLNKLLQIAQGFIYDETGRPHRIHGNKIKALADIVDELQGEPLLTFFQYQEDAAAIREALPEAVFMSDCSNASQARQVLHDFNAGKIQHLLGHPASIGHGLNAQERCHHVAMLGVGWDEELHQQAIKRVWRQGQKKRVTLHYIFATDTVDQRVLEVLRRKRVVEDNLLTGLKNI